jgi:hypothetical protein
MKRKVLMLMTIIFAGIMTANAQGGGNFPRLTIEERVKRIHDKIDSAFTLGPTKMADVDSIFTQYYRKQTKIREDMMAAAGGGQIDRQAMTDQMKPVMDDRDAKLKTALGDDKYKIWKEQIEPSMQPPRRNQ